MKLPPNTTLACIYDLHADCLNEDCGCSCHGPTQIQESTDATT
jgi:hypothetical protein